MHNLLALLKICHEYVIVLQEVDWLKIVVHILKIFAMQSLMLHFNDEGLVTINGLRREAGDSLLVTPSLPNMTLVPLPSGSNEPILTLVVLYVR